MSVAYLNGEFVPLHEAKVSVFDRGFMFADGVYEVTAVVNGTLIDNESHMIRLERSLGEIAIPVPMPLAQIAALQDELVRRNGLREGTIYIQITRGLGDRYFHFPERMNPSFVMLTQECELLSTPEAKTGIRVVSVPDIRWKRRDIKTVALVAQVMAKQAAFAAGAGEAWMVEDNMVTEGGSSNAFIVNADNTIITRKTNSFILAGVTRKAVIALAKERDISLEERSFSLKEAYSAREAFLTSASTFVLPIIQVDDHIIADGKPGGLTRRLREIYLEFVHQQSGGDGNDK
jgi:D-alanine transaminase